MLLHNIILDMTIGMVIFISLLLGGFYYLFVFDNGDSIKQATTSLVNNEALAQKEIKELKEKLTHLERMKQVLDRTQDEVNKFLRFMPNTLTSLMILNNLNANAKDSGVILENIKTRELPAQDRRPYSIVQVNLNIKGLFNQILVFLSRLTDSPEIITFHEFTLRNENMMDSGSSGSIKYGQITMTATIHGYKYNEPIQAKADTPQ